MQARVAESLKQLSDRARALLAVVEAAREIVADGGGSDALKKALAKLDGKNGQP